MYHLSTVWIEKELKRYKNPMCQTFKSLTEYRSFVKGRINNFFNTYHLRVLSLDTISFQLTPSRRHYLGQIKEDPETNVLKNNEIRKPDRGVF